MEQKILVPLDDSVTAHKTIERMIACRERFPRHIHLLHVVDVQSIQRLLPDLQKEMVYDSAKKTGARVLARLAEEFRAAGFEPELHLELGSPGETIETVAGKLEIDLLVIGRHPGGGGLRDILFGSVANHVIRSSKCPLLLI